MKKIIAFLTAVLLISTVCVFPVSASEVTISNVYPEGSSSYKSGDSVTVMGKCTPGKDVVIRIYDQNDVLIYTDTIIAPNNTSGTFKFSGFKIPEVGTSSKLYYTVVVSETKSGTETTNVDTENMIINGSSGGHSGGGGGGGNTLRDEPPSMVVPWVPKKTTDNTQTAQEEQDRADKDPIGDTERNKELWDKVGSVDTEKKAETAIDDITKATDKEELKKETARNNVAVAGETMTANLGAKTKTVNYTNTLVLNAASVTDYDLKKLDGAMTTIENAIKKNSITLNRQMEKELVVNTSFNNKKIAKIEVHRDLADKLVKSGVDTITVKDNDLKITYDVNELAEAFGSETKDVLSYQLDKSSLSSSVKKVTVNFDTNSTQTLKISFPGLKSDTSYMAIVDENGHPVGGRYNPATGVIEARISESGVYELVNNEKNFEDIKGLSNEMQNSIKILASKGIIEGTSVSEFSPEDNISRAEVAALLLRVLSQIDPNADGGFADVKRTDWFFGTAGSAKQYGMIRGFDDNTFRGNDIIAKDQILAVAARILKKEMKYYTPQNPGEWLTFRDASTIAEWAREDIALATMANIITRTADNTIRADEKMTRGDAALIIMRLFYKIW